MRINTSAFRVQFQKALPTCLKKDYKKSVSDAKKALGIQNGLSILKIHSGSMPQQDTFDSGIGKLNSKPAIDFIDTMTFYTDTNAVKEFPKGQTTKHFDQFFCPYLKTALTFGEENINLLNLVEDKETYGDILSKDDIKQLNLNLGSRMIIYENELGTDENYPILAPLRKAFYNFMNGKNIPDKLKDEYEQFKKDPLIEDTYSRLALYPIVHEKEPDLFKGFNCSKEKQAKFEKYKIEYQDEIEFFKFRQFLAKKEHDSAKDKINSMGVDLFGDCLIGFSNQEVWAYPDAFLKDTCIGLYDWGLPALDFSQILNPDSEAHKVFNNKISFFLKNYDGIRFDVGWCYAIAKLGEKDKESVDLDLGHDLFDFIEKRAKEIKGDDYDTKKLIYEMDGFEQLYKWTDNKPPEILPNVKGIVNVLTTEYQHNNDFGWGSPDFHLKHGLNEDEIIMGTNNHDGINLLNFANAKDRDTAWSTNIEILSKLFKINPNDFIEDITTFIKAKFAQIFTIKNQFLFQNDVLGLSREMDFQSADPENYRTRIDKDFEKRYHQALQNGIAFNLPESLKMAMEAKNLDKKYPDIYKKISFYSDYLKEKGALTEKDANLSINT